MRKTITIFCLLLYAISANAKTEHLKFLGIPITGSIDAFQKKLADKGIYPDKYSFPILNSENFKGNYAGYNARISVDYDESTVNTVNVFINVYAKDKKTHDIHFNKLANLIKSNFADEKQLIEVKKDTIMDDGHDRYLLITTNGYIIIYGQYHFPNNTSKGEYDVEIPEFLVHYFDKEYYDKKYSSKEELYKFLLPKGLYDGFEVIDEAPHLDSDLVFEGLPEDSIGIYDPNIWEPTEHIKFKGIPLTGTITHFQKFLEAKGVKPNKEINRNTPVGVRCFKGDFAGYDADIFIYYDKLSKLVYRGKACIINNDKELATEIYNQIKNLVEIKFQKMDVTHVTTDEPFGKSYENGDIYVLFTTLNNKHTTIYAVTIEYTDRINFRKHQNALLEDI